MLARRHLALVVLCTALVASAACKKHKKDPNRATREALLAELQPVALSNCDLKRYGSPNDGGYLACANLMSGAQSAYSYGIEHGLLAPLWAGSTDAATEIVPARPTKTVALAGIAGAPG